jgi:hypothetical protein
MSKKNSAVIFIFMVVTLKIQLFNTIFVATTLKIVYD